MNLGKSKRLERNKKTHNMRKQMSDEIVLKNIDFKMVHRLVRFFSELPKLYLWI